MKPMWFSITEIMVVLAGRLAAIVAFTCVGTGQFASTYRIIDDLPSLQSGFKSRIISSLSSFCAFVGATILRVAPCTGGFLSVLALLICLEFGLSFGTMRILEADSLAGGLAFWRSPIGGLLGTDARFTGGSMAILVALVLAKLIERFDLTALGTLFELHVSTPLYDDGANTLYTMMAQSARGGVMEDPLVAKVSDRLDQAETLIDVSEIAASLSEEERNEPKIRMMILGKTKYLIAALQSKRQQEGRERWHAS
jgi:hypothetical protein